MKKIFSALFLLLCFSALNAQVFDELDTQPCGAQPNSFPLPASEWQQEPAVYAPGSVDKVIPVVFHVLHQSGIENVSREDLQWVDSKDRPAAQPKKIIVL